MKTTERFDRAIKALVQAFFDESLVKQSCAACACGNIIAASYGKRVVVNKRRPSETVSPIDSSYFLDWYYTIRDLNYCGEEVKRNGERYILNTGYSLSEFTRIEAAFEQNTRIPGGSYPRFLKDEIMQDQFNGLMAVVDVLCEIDGYDATPYKKMFEYTEDFKPVNVL